MSSSRPELAALLTQHSVRTGTFTLASGATSDIYCDVKKTALLGRGANLIGHHLHALARDADADAVAVGGLTLGADPLVTAISIAAHQADDDLCAIIVRKEAKDHGTRRAIEMPLHLKRGDRVVAVDDTITTGGSTLKAVEALRQAGFIVEHAICVVDREQGGHAHLATHGVRLHALYTLEELRPDEDVATSEE